MSNLNVTVEHNGAEYSGEIMRIERTSLGREDHNIVTGYLHCRGDGTGVGLGGYRLDEFDRQAGESHGTGYGLDWIMRVMETVGVESWEKLPGQRVIGLFKSPGHLGQTAVGIANVDTGKALIWSEHAEEWRSRGV